MVALPLARAAAGDAPPGYQLVTMTPLGRSFSTQKPGVKTIQAALLATERDLTSYFAVKPTLSNAYEDVRNHRSGGAAFSVTYAGGPIKGLIFCKLGPRGASVAVVGASVNVSPAEWSKLMGAPVATPVGAPAPAATPNPQTPSAPANASLHTVSFSDGTGTIGLPPGWHADLKTCAWGVIVQGPADQRVLVGTMATVYLPNSTFVRQQRTMPGGGIFVMNAPFVAPADALRMLGPQLSRTAALNHYPTFVLDNVAEKKPLKPMFPRGRSALVTYGVTENGRRGRRHYKTFAQLDLVPPAGEFWMLRFTGEVRAPDATFEHDLPLMLAIAASWKGNDAAMARRINGQTAANKRSFDRFEQQQAEKSAAFDKYIAGTEAASNDRISQANADEKASNDRLRSANDFDEVIRGVRTVEDTQTGERKSVNLGDVDNIVDKLNEHDSGRYRQIPLRDEAEGQ